MSLELVPRGYPEPSRGDIPVPSEKQLVRLLREFAFNNMRFRRGEADQVHIAISDTVEFWVPDTPDVEDTEIPEQAEYFWAAAQSEMEIGYQFHAQRFCPPRPGRKPVVEFIFGVTAEHTNVLLPLDIAQEITDLHGQAAVDAIGPVRYERSMQFDISTARPVLSAYDSYQYTAIDGDVIHQGSSGESEADLQPRYALLFRDEDDDAGSEEDTITLPPVMQFVTPVAHERLRHETMDFSDYDEALKVWATIDQPPIDLDSVIYEENLRYALSTLNGLKRALRQQAGVQ